MKNITLIIVLLCLGISAAAQDPPIATLIKAVPPEQFISQKLFRISEDRFPELDKVVSYYGILRAEQTLLARIAGNEFPALEIDIPVEGSVMTVQLIRSRGIDERTIFTSQAGDRKEDSRYNKGAYYNGIIKGQNNSLVAISFFNDDITGILMNDKGNFVLSKNKATGTKPGQYVVYNDRNLKSKEGITCDMKTAEQELPVIPVESIKKVADAASDKCIKVYVETDRQTYIMHSYNVTNVNNYVTSVFNIVSTIYQNESIALSVSQVHVWTTADPYVLAADTVAGQALPRFATAMASGFNGDLAHLITLLRGGGRAYLDVLCNSNYSIKTGVSGGITGNILPLIANTGMAICVAHEIGHNLGSPHTHACVWNGNNTAIDYCGPTYKPSYAEGTCPNAGLPPSNGGTIMSYCHLNAGINQNNGFGTQPGNLIRSKVNDAACLRACDAFCIPDVFITGNYGVALKESPNWIKSSNTLTITNNVSVKLDADPANGYIEFAPGASDFVSAQPLSSGVFVAQALDGCKAGIPVKGSGGNFGSPVASAFTANGFLIYPNPAEHYCTLTTKEEYPVSGIELLDINGRTQSITIQDMGNNSRKISWGRLSNGLYLIRLTSDQKNETLKLIIQQ